MRVSRGIGDDNRCRRWLKTRISPMLLVSTTYPLPAHRPWSAGSMSPSGLVGSEALSTAFRPLTPTAPPADVLMESQPGPGQLTVGAGEMGGSAAGGSELPLAPRETGAGMTCGGSDAAAFVASVFAAAALATTAGDEAERPAVDGVETGPVSR